jgi:DnaJ-class molecular chaperone
MPFEERCPHCKGDGTAMVAGKQINCVGCNGDKVIPTGEGESLLTFLTRCLKNGRLKPIGGKSSNPFGDLFG